MDEANHFRMLSAGGALAPRRIVVRSEFVDIVLQVDYERSRGAAVDEFIQPALVRWIKNIFARDRMLARVGQHERALLVSVELSGRSNHLAMLLKRLLNDFGVEARQLERGFQVFLQLCVGSPYVSVLVEDVIERHLVRV